MAPHVATEWHWAHNCCSKADLAHALSNPGVTPIEAAPALASRAACRSWRTRRTTSRDLTYVDFLESCLADGRRSIKLDFKQPECLRPRSTCSRRARARARARVDARPRRGRSRALSLLLLLRYAPRVYATRQVVWLNATCSPAPAPTSARAAAHSCGERVHRALPPARAVGGALARLPGRPRLRPARLPRVPPSHVEAMLAVSRQADPALFVFAVQARLAARAATASRSCASCCARRR